MDSGTVRTIITCTFTGDFNPGTYVFDMKNNLLTLVNSSATLNNGRVIYTGKLVAVSNPTINNIAHEGAISLKDAFLIRDATFKYDPTPVYYPMCQQQRFSCC